MRLSIAVAGVVLSFASVLAGCDSAPPSAVARASFDQAANAPTIVRQVETTPIDFTFPYCAAEPIAFTGEQTRSTQLVFDGAGGVHVHADLRGHAKGTGTVTGTKYELIQREVYTTHAERLPQVVTVVQNFRVVGPGPGNDWVVHSLQRWTINANGVMVNDIYWWVNGCR